MGHRANLITVENGEYILRYDHWCAIRLDTILFFGPKYALKYFDAQEEMGQRGWLDDLWAEGGAVLDFDKKHLLFWGGDGINYDVPLRRVYLRLQKEIWNGWTVEWAHRGIIDLAEYVSYPKENVIFEPKYEPDSISLIESESGQSDPDGFGVFQSSGGENRLFLLTGQAYQYLRIGSDLNKQCKTEPGYELILWKEVQSSGMFPQSGFWINEKERIIEFWDARDCPERVQQLKAIWDEWEIIWHLDNYEMIADRIKERLVLPDIDEGKLIRKVCEKVFRPIAPPIDGGSKLADMIQEKGHDVSISPWFFKSHAVEDDFKAKKEIWMKYVGEFEND